jgi:hypothetical protein
MPDKPMPRNFIYLDFERVRSILSQLDMGLMETIERAREREQETGVDGEGGFWPFAKVGASGSLLFKQGDTETRSLHHYLYALFEELAHKQHMLRDLNDQFQNESWQTGTAQSSLQPGNLFCIKAPLTILDYEYMTETLKLVMSAGAQLPAITGTAGPISKSQKAQIEAMTEFIKALFPAVVSLKIYPDASSIAYLRGQLEPANLQYKRENLLFLYGQDRQTTWTVVGLIASIPETAATAPPITGSDVETVLEQAFSGITGHGVKYSVSPPSIGIVPLAIYEPITGLPD